MKVCRKCDKCLDNKMFGRRVDLSDGLNYICKECDRKKSIKYHYTHKKKCNKKSILYYKNNSKRIKNEMKTKYWSNPKLSRKNSIKKTSNNPDVYRKIASRSYNKRRKKVLIWHKEKTKTLDNYYIENYLKKSHGLSGTNIPKNIIDLKRNQLKTYRYVFN